MRFVIFIIITAVFLSCTSQMPISPTDNGIIDLSNKSLKRVPSKIIKNGDKVNSLILSDNNFDNFPLVVTELKNLKTLSLKNNDLSVIPEEISNLTKLQTLDLRGTKVTSLPASMDKMNDLKLVLMFEIDLLDSQKNQIKCVMPDGCEVMFSKKYREYPPYDCPESN